MARNWLYKHNPTAHANEATGCLWRKIPAEWQNVEIFTGPFMFCLGEQNLCEAGGGGHRGLMAPPCSLAAAPLQICALVTSRGCSDPSPQNFLRTFWLMECQKRSLLIFSRDYFLPFEGVLRAGEAVHTSGGIQSGNGVALESPGEVSRLCHFRLKTVGSSGTSGMKTGKRPAYAN